MKIISLFLVGLIWSSGLLAHHAESPECLAKPVTCLEKKEEEIAKTASIGASIREAETLDHKPVFEVMALEEGGAALKAGFAPGDLISSWNGRTVTGDSSHDFLRFHRTLAIGQKVTYELLRGDRTLQVSVEARPRSAESIATSLRRFAWETFGCTYEEVLSMAKAEEQQDIAP